VCVCVCVCVSGLTASEARMQRQAHDDAARLQQLEQDVRACTAKLAEAEAEAAAAKDAIESMRGANKAKVEELCDQLQQLQRRMEQCAARAEALEADVGQAQAELRRAQEEQEKREQEARERRRALVRGAIALQGAISELPVAQDALEVAMTPSPPPEQARKSAGRGGEGAVGAPSSAFGTDLSLQGLFNTLGRNQGSQQEHKRPAAAEAAAAAAGTQNDDAHDDDDGDDGIDEDATHLARVPAACSQVLVCHTATACMCSCPPDSC